MKCEQCRQLILSLPDPGQASGEAVQHLANCAACRDLVRRLNKIEHCVQELPAPVSERKQVFLAFFLNPTHPASAPPAPKRPRRIWEWLRRHGPIASAAAVLIAVGIWLGAWVARSGRKSEPIARPTMPAPVEKKQEKDELPDASLAAIVLECDLELAATNDPVRRVEVLARLGHQLRGESRWLAKASADKELARLSALHARVLKEGLLPRAKVLPMDQRRRTLEPITQELAQSHLQLKAFAPGLDGVARVRLDEIAEATHLASLTLNRLIEEARP